MSDEPDVATAPTAAISQDRTCEQEYFRLFDLPIELVLRVLEFSVIISSKEKPLLIKRFSAEPWAASSDDLSAKQPAIMRTCRLFRIDGLKLFYTQNVFLGASSDDDAPAFWSWAEAIGQDNRQRVYQLYVAWVDDHGEQFCQYQDGKLFDVDVDTEMRASQLLEEVEYLASRNHQFKGPPACFFQPHYNKIVLDVAYDHPRYRISFRAQDNDGWQILVCGSHVKDYIVFSDEEGVDFWDAEEGD